jgi:chitin disaccharide deacetylase
LTGQRVLIVNADDFGRSAGINAGVVRAHTAGIVTSASLMVRWPAAADAVKMARSVPGLSLGLHLDLGEWAFRDGEWQPLYEVAPTDDADAVAQEVRAQLSRFRELVARDPTHVDSHQHVHRDGVVAEVVEALARPLGVPVRDRHSQIAYCGDFYGQTGRGEPLHENITAAALIAILRRLPSGVTELACHPGEPDGADPVYDAERALELDSLCDARVRVALDEEGIELRSFADAFD